MNVLTEAQTLIDGAREEMYGRATTSFNRIGALWSDYLGIEVTALDVTNLMILLKVSRTKGTYHRDSYVDIAGYAGLGERLYDQAAEAEVPDENGFDEWWDFLINSDREFNEYGDPPGCDVVLNYQDFYALDDRDKELLWDVDEEREEWELGLAEARTQYQGCLNNDGERRVWWSISEVPHDILVQGAGGEVWSFHDDLGEWGWSRTHPSAGPDISYSLGAPYTEILEGIE